MNEDHSPIDDDLLSAVLDGEATPAERALVEASPEALERLGQLRAAAARVGERVAPLDPEVSGRLVARALDEALPAGTAVPDAVGTVTPGRLEGPARHDELAARRRRGRGAGWAAALAGVAAAVLLVVVGIGLARGGSRDSASDASGSTAAGTAAESGNVTADAADQAAPTAAPTLADLGPLPDVATVLERFAVLESSDAGFDHQFADGSSAASSTAERSAEGSAASSTACAVPPVAPRPGEVWVAAATAELPAGPVLVMLDRSGVEGARVLVVDATTCAVLAEGSV